MEYYESKRMMEFFGLLPNNSPLEFIRFPPGISLKPTGLLRPNQLKEEFIKKNLSVNSRLQEFQQLRQNFVAGLLDSSKDIIPPGHPLYSQRNSVSIIQIENEKIKKENMELKKQLDESSKIKPPIIK